MLSKALTAQIQGALHNDEPQNLTSSANFFLSASCVQARRHHPEWVLCNMLIPRGKRQYFNWLLEFIVFIICLAFSTLLWLLFSHCWNRISLSLRASSWFLTVLMTKPRCTNTWWRALPSLINSVSYICTSLSAELQRGQKPWKQSHINVRSASDSVIYYDCSVPEEERHDFAVKRNKEALTAELKLWEGYLENVRTIRTHLCTLAGTHTLCWQYCVFHFSI